jgi:CBS domain-containing protein
MNTGITVMDAMTKHPVTVEPSATVKACAEKMLEYSIGSLIVVEDEHIAGVLTEQDIIRKVVASGKAPESVLARNIMSTSVISISPDADIYDAIVKMRDSGIRHLPVTTEKQLIGFLTLKDVLKIEPDLFDLIVERFELREEEDKPVFGNAGTGQTPSGAVTACEACGVISDSLEEMFGSYLCEDCREQQAPLQSDEIVH